MKQKPHTLDYRKCNCSEKDKLHEIGWFIDNEHKIYKEIAECLTCGDEKISELSEKEVFMEEYDANRTRTIKQNTCRKS